MKKIILISFYISLIQGLYAQSDIVCSGGNIVESTGEINFSIGQVFVSYNESSNIIQNQGVQHPMEWFKLNSGIQTIYKSEQISIFPNPTLDFIQIDYDQYSTLTFIILDMTGKKLAEGNLKHSNKIDFSFLPTNIYILSLNKDSIWIQSSKVEKR